MTIHQRGSIVLRDEAPGTATDNLHISLSHSPQQNLVIQSADRWDLLLVLMEAQGVDPDMIALVDPSTPAPPPTNRPCHPRQPAVIVNGIIRFHANAIVQWMLERGEAGQKFNLNTIACEDFSDDDRQQLSQLTGYSVSGYGDLSFHDPDIEAAAQAEGMAILGLPQPKSRWFNMDGMAHEFGTTCCRLWRGRECSRCGGAVHFQPVYGGILDLCEECDVEGAVSEAEAGEQL